MKILLSLLFSSITLFGFSQDTQIGVLFGTNWSDIKSKSFFDDTKKRNGSHFGITFEKPMYQGKYQLNSKYLVQLRYHEKGFVYQSDFSDSDGNMVASGLRTQFNYDYISLPLGIGHFLPIGCRGELFLRAFVVPAFIIKAETITPAFNAIEEQNTDVSDRINAFDLSMSLEMGGGVYLGNRLHLYISGEFQPGITKITNEDYFNDEDLRNTSLMASLGLKYTI